MLMLWGMLAVGYEATESAWLQLLFNLGFVGIELALLYWVMEAQHGVLVAGWFELSVMGVGRNGLWGVLELGCPGR